MLAKKIATNTIISATARVLGTLLALLTIGLITRYLTKNEWGEYSIMLTFGGIFAVLADLGLYQLMVRDISRTGADEQKIASNIFTIRLLSGFFIFSAAPLVSLLFPYSGQARLGILVGMAGFWFLANSQVLMGLFQKHLQMGRVAIAELAGRIIQLGLVWLFIWRGYDFLYIVATLSISGAVNFLLVFFSAKKYCNLKLAFDWPYWKNVFKQGYPLAISSVLVMVYFSSDSLFLSVLKPAADVGAYRLPYKVLESLIFFPAMFVGLIMPIISGSIFTDQIRFRKIFQRGHDVLAILIAPLILGTIFLSPVIISLLGGGKYSESVIILNILIVAVGIIFLGTLFSYILIALEKQKVLLWISAVGAIFNVVANLIFIPRYSYYAAATTTVLTEALVAILMVTAIYHFLRWLPSFKIFFKSLLASMVMVLVLWFLVGVNLGFSIMAAIIIYFLALYFLHGLPRQDLESLIKGEEIKL